MLEMFEAGMHTSATTMLWAVLYMCLYPDIQNKVQKEIDAVIGNKRQPSWSDRLNMPYTMACMKEILRCAPVAPFGIPHRNESATTLGGYRIPANSAIFPNIWKIHNDPKYWNKPDEFNPDRFLGKDGSCPAYNRYLMPFGKGNFIDM